MRYLMALASIAASPSLAASPPLCALQGPSVIPRAENVAKFVPTASASPAIPRALVPDALSGIPFVQHIAAAGAVVTDLGVAHGMPGFAARNGDQFMIFQVAPDGQAAVSGAMTDITPTQLSAIAGANVSDLGIQHGLKGIFVRSGAQFQVFYATPDNERVIPGVLWDAAGKDLTRQAVSNIPGAIPTVVVDDADPAKPGGTAVAALPLIQNAIAGTVGAATAPHLWMLIDPQCIYSVRAYQMLQPYVSSGRLQLSVIPLSVLDYEDKGQSTRSALALLSNPSEQIVSSGQAGKTEGPSAPAAADRLRINMAISNAIQLHGTPTFVWRKSDGTEGRMDGLPTNVEALVASIGS
jgi:thiol:disulfide interchange protein DsbG